MTRVLVVFVRELRSTALMATFVSLHYVQTPVVVTIPPTQTPATMVMRVHPMMCVQVGCVQVLPSSAPPATRVSLLLVTRRLVVC